MNHFALYIHYPFCIKRCPYCGFATAVEKRDLAQHYRDALLDELKYRSNDPDWSECAVSSIYFGGGTPSLMPPEFLDQLLKEIRHIWRLIPDAEITLEANPETRDANNFAAFRSAGVNRISMGAQSFHPRELKLLGRAHSADGIGAAVKTARDAGFKNISLDLIYGIPGQSVNGFIQNVQRAIGLGINHLSAYTLSIEPNTPFAGRVNSGRLAKPDGDHAADQYAMLWQMMRDNGFEHYELTNYAKPGYYSRHNSAYWRHVPYLGLGCSAHSFNGRRRRWWNVRNTQEYIDRIHLNTDALDGEEILTDKQIIEESVYLSLRTRAGVEIDFLAERADLDALTAMLDAGILRAESGRVVMAEEHWLLLDEVVLRLFDGG